MFEEFNVRLFSSATRLLFPRDQSAARQIIHNKAALNQVGTVRSVVAGRRSPPIAFWEAIADFSVSRLGTGFDLAVVHDARPLKLFLQLEGQGPKAG
jgi:hypothetical protein